MNKTQSYQDAYPVETRDVLLKTAAYKAQVDAAGNVVLQVPCHAGPLFDSQYMEYLAKQHGGVEAERMLDTVADKLLQLETVQYITQ